MSGPFAEAALELRSFGLAPIPCGDDDGKVPGLRTKAWKHAPGADTLRRMTQRFPSANVGILTGLSGVTVADGDCGISLDEMLHHFGDTPLITKTPSDGVHLYYRSSGEQCANLRRPMQIPVDIKGIGGFVVVPPSVRPSGDHAGKAYKFVTGGWDDLRRLPRINPGSLPGRPQAPPKPGARQGTIPEGTRHDELLQRALKDARCCDCSADLLDSVRGDNQNCIPPLPDADVGRIASWAWRCQSEGRNFATKEERSVFKRVSEVQALGRSQHGAKASLLLDVLRCEHFDGKPFALSPRAMWQSQRLFGWSERNYRDARTLLVDLGILSLVYEGGKGLGDPSLFRFVPVGDKQA